jgi:hypothetical protein
MSERIGRNDPCPCGSGRKFKRCCLNSEIPPEIQLSDDGGLITVPGWLAMIQRTGRGPLNVPPFQPGTTTLTAFTDESGNTGIDIFDSHQPLFHTGTLVTGSDLEAEAPALQAELAKHAIVELHASELKEKGLEPVANYLRELIARHDCRFIFTEAEKVHYGVLKLADTLLDSGNNKALMPHQYYYRPLKALLTAGLNAIVDDRPELLKDFWRGYTQNKEPVFRKALQDIRAEGEVRPTYPRNRQVLLDALDWGIANPRDLMDSLNKAFNGPNVVAVVQIAHCLHLLMAGQPELRVGRFIHDRQSQFAPAIKQMYETVARFKTVDSALPLTVPEEIVESQALVQHIEMHDGSLVGLQLADTALWLVKRVKDGKPPELPACRRLLEEVASRGMFRELTREQFYREAQADMDALMARPITAEEEQRARVLVDELEAKRQQRMRGQG